MRNRALRVLVGALSILLLSSLAAAQDVDVPGNLTMADSTDTTGNILKAGIPFIHNFGMENTFIGSNAGNFTMSGFRNTATGSDALSSNTTGTGNTANGFLALNLNTTGGGNVASGLIALSSNTAGSYNTAIGTGALWRNSTGNYNTAIGTGTLFGNRIGEYNTASGTDALVGNITGNFNTATGHDALRQNTTGSNNTATGHDALRSNAAGNNNTAIGFFADVSADTLTNATAIGAFAIVDASNKIRLGNANVTAIEGQVGFTASSDRNQKENLQPVNGEEVLAKISELSLTSWNFIGHDPKQFRHYGPMAQDFFAAFGRDGIGTIGTETTITSTDIDGILMVAAQALEKRAVEQTKRIDALTSENTELKARLEALERRVANYTPTKTD